jgi:hypothetical protein
MTKRPLASRFNQAVLDELKFTTIRDKHWPVGKPIMLYNWSGKAYRSRQADIAAVVVMGFWTIRITRLADGRMEYEHGMVNAKPLWQTEGFASQAEMDDWFRPLTKPGQTLTKALMRFRLAPLAQG